MFPYLMDDESKDKKAKGTKKCLIKRIVKFNDYKDCLFNNQMILKLHPSKKKTQSKVALYSRSTIQSVNNWRFWIW